MRFSAFARSALQATMRATRRLLVLTAVFVIAQPAFAAIPQAERDALINLYNAAAGPQWTTHSGWTGVAGTECSWSGVSCDAGQTTVVGLALSNNHLAGTLSPLTALTHLNNVDVSQNALGGPLPSMAGLSQLQVFNAFSNQFTGTLPDLSSQAALQQFRVWGNQLSGSLPAFSATTNLVYFDASNNQLTGTIPAIAQLGLLEQFLVGSNQLTGTIPSLAALSKLKKLDVSYNRLTGALPDLSTDTALQTLYVDHNNLSGSLPAPPANLAIATVCPNTQLTRSANAQWDVLTGQSPWYAACGGPAMFVITDVNSGYSPAVGASFSVTVGLRDSNGAPAVAPSSYGVGLSVSHGIGQLTNNAYCYINTGASSCTIQGVTYSAVESGVQIRAVAQYQFSSPVPAAGTATFDVVAGIYTVGGSVSGLVGPGLVLRLSPTGETVNVNADGNFTFPGPLGDGAYYSVDVLTQPSYPPQSCVVNAAAGNILSGNITTVKVVCTRQYSIVLRVGPNGQASTFSPVLSGSAANIYVSAYNGYRAVVAAQGCTVTHNYSIIYSTSPLSSDCVVTITFRPLDYTPLTPIRVLNSLPSGTTADGQYAAVAPLSASTTLAVQILGRPNIPTSGVGALVLNVVATNTSAPGYVTVWPSCGPRPNASNLNFEAHQTVSNLVIVPVGCDSTINFLSSTGPTDLIVDVVGFFNTNGSLTSLSPSRLLDTRPGYTTIDGQAQNGGAVPAQAQFDLTVAGRAGIPANASGVALNITATDPTAPAFVTVWPTDQARPNASNLNVVAGQTIPNLVIAKLSAAGQISLFNSAGSTDLIADAVAWFPATSDLAPLVPARLVDTRRGYSTVDGNYLGAGPISAGQSLVFNAYGRGGVPAESVGALVLNVTVTNPSTAGFLSVNGNLAYIYGFVQNVNFSAGQTVPSLVIVPANGNYLSVYSSATTDVVIDVVGWIQGQ